MSAAVCTFHAQEAKGCIVKPPILYLVRNCYFMCYVKALTIFVVLELFLNKLNAFGLIFYQIRAFIKMTINKIAFSAPYSSLPVSDLINNCQTSNLR